MELKIEYVPIDSIKPYKGNAKKHPKKQIEQIKQSIIAMKDADGDLLTGFKNPLGVWHNEIATGHGRYIAAKELGLEKIPIIRLDSMTDEQRRAYIMIDNQLTLNTENDLKQLAIELESIKSIDMPAFSLDLPEINLQIEKQDQEHLQNVENTRFDVRNILNLEKGQFTGVGKYDMPMLEAVRELPEIKEWISFNYVLTDKEPEGKAVHFFIDDYQFERLFNSPEKYVDKLRKYICVATPDFSPYGDMPLIAQMWNHYRKQWVGAWLQQHGVTVIPTIRCSTDERSLEWYLDGIPKCGIVIMSSMWTGDESMSDISKTEYLTMKKTIKPKKVFIYGKDTGNMGISPDDNVEYIKNFTQNRWGKD